MINTKDCDWLAQHSLELSTRYPGKWVAVYDGQVIGVGETVLEADTQAIMKRPQHDYILEQMTVDLDMPHVE